MIDVFSNIPLGYAHDGDAASDLRAIEDVVIPSGKHALVFTELHIAIPKGTAGLVCSRSGLAAKHGVFVLNAPGIIDSGYRDTVGVILMNSGDEDFIISKNDRIAQLMIIDIPEVNNVVVSKEEVREIEGDQRNGGFGSSGVK